MKLASLKHGRDGKLVIVSRDLSIAVTVPEIAPSLQFALDNWSELAPKLQAKSDALNNREIDGFVFVESDCASPLPRAYQWLDGSAYLNHVELVHDYY